MVVSTAELPRTLTAKAARRRRLIQFPTLVARGGEEDMTIPFVGKWP
jgi:hypothetical protein